MRYQLINPINPKYSTIETILTNRHIPLGEVTHYLNTTDDDINRPEAFGQDHLVQAAQCLIQHISAGSHALIIVDCDCDGFTSAALLINYLHDLFPSWIESNVKWWVHEGKQHGLNDCMDYINSHSFNLVLIPDAGSNDYEAHATLKKENIDTIILDHHLADKISDDAIVINNQLSDYPNKELSGVGVVWQFCRYIDEKMQTNYADYYLDLVALGLTGDMMSLTSIETKHLIMKGFEPENIHNPYIYEMWQKNKFKLGEHITSIDAAFYIVPMINAVQRSGEIEEKELLFKSMLKHEAFEMIPSNKRGHAPGEMERLVDQAVRMSTNVKNRQTREQDKTMEELELLIEDLGLLDHKVILFTLDDKELNRNIAGLIANKIANKYQRPCCILSKTLEIDPGHTTMLQDGTEVFVTSASRVLYQGSARGYEATGVTNFKTICEAAGAEWCQGHENAFGMCLAEDQIERFLTETDAALANISAEPIYYVDYIYNGADVQASDILTIANLGNLWGKDFDEALVAVENLKISKDMITVYRKTGNTLKISLPNKISLMKFNATDEECFKLENFEGAYLSLNIVGKCNQNEWMGNISPQIFIEDYEITGSGKYLF